jgi:TonB family protein
MMLSIEGRGLVAVFSVVILAFQASGQNQGADAPGVTFTSSNAEFFASRLLATEFSGISPEAEQQIRSLLQFREGDNIGPRARDSVQTAVQGFDSRLNASFVIRNGTDTTLRIAPGGSAGPLVQVAAAAAYPLGAGVMSPIPTYQPDPQYTEEIRKAHCQGSVPVSAVIDENGTPTNMKVVRPALGRCQGMDEKAIEAASQWKFKPGTKDGVPVSVPAQLEVVFRLP